MAFHAVIFDLDGTLIDSMGVWEKVPDQLVRRLGGEPFPGLADALRTRDLRGGAEKLIQIYGWDLTADQVLELQDLQAYNKSDNQMSVTFHLFYLRICRCLLSH